MTAEQYEALLTDARRQIERVRRANARAAGETWALADILARFELTNGGAFNGWVKGAPRARTPGSRRDRRERRAGGDVAEMNGDSTQRKDPGAVTLPRLAADLGYSRTWVSVLRSAARRFPPEMRIPTVSVTTHVAAVRRYGTPEKAIAELRKLGQDASVWDVDPAERIGRVLKVLQDPDEARLVVDSLPTTDRVFLEELLAENPEEVAGLPFSELLERRALIVLRRVRTMLRNVAIGEKPSESLLREIDAVEQIARELNERAASVV